MKPFTAEHRANISKARMGKPGWNKGMHLTETHRRRIGMAHKGRPKSALTKAKLSELAKERWRDPEYREKERLSHIGLVSKRIGMHHSEETKRKISEASGGRHPAYCIECGKEIDRRAKRCFRCNSNSEEFKAKVGQGHKGQKGRLGQHNTPEHNAKVRLARLGMIASPEARRRMSASRMGEGNAFYGRHHTKKTRKQIAAKARAQWQDDEWVRKYMLGLNLKPNKPERKLDGILQQQFPGIFKYVGDGEFILAGKCPDFVNVNGKKQLIELYGNFWHANDDPQDRIDFFKQYGYDTLVVWQSELDDLVSLKERLNAFCLG